MSSFAPELLQGKTFLVTGASSGIGAAVSRELAAVGARVIASGRNAERLQNLVAQLPSRDHLSAPMVLDSPDRIADWCRELALKSQGIDGIFHAAGTELIRPVRLTREAQLKEVLDASLLAAFGLARAAASRGVMKETGGSVVFMSSVAGLRGQGGMAAYSAAKAAVDGLVRSLAAELARRRIRVNSIAAGAVRTEMHDRLVNALGSEAVAEYEGRHLLGFGEPPDIAAAAIYLLSGLSKWVTGTTMVVDGGYIVR